MPRLLKLIFVSVAKVDEELGKDNSEKSRFQQFGNGQIPLGSAATFCLIGRV